MTQVASFRLRALLIYIACSFSPHPAALAQMDTAILAGRITDSSGAAVGGARVDLIDIDRNVRTTTRTAKIGLYVFPDAPPGHYRVEVSALGFKTVILSRITLNTQDSIEENVRLAIGSPSESLMLETNGLATELSGSVRAVVDQTLVRELPLNGRSFQTLFQLTPGIVISPTSFASQGQFSAGGQRTDANYFIVDGVSANFGIAAGVDPGQSAGGSLPALSAFGGTNILISTDDVREFAIATSSYAPEIGRTPGAQVSVVSRSGTNEFHGNLFDYLRNDALDANDWFANRNSLKRAALRQNDYGGILGGPIQKNRTFFFLSYEGLRLLQPALRQSDVPSLRARISAPESIRPFLESYPLPTGPEEGNGLAPATYAFSNQSSQDAASVRIDHRWGDSLAIFARYNKGVSDRKERGAGNAALNSVTDTEFALQTLTVALSYLIKPRLINDLRLNWSMASASSRSDLDTFGGSIPLSPSLVFPHPFNDQNSLFQFLPALGDQNLVLLFGRNAANTQSQLTIVDNASWQLGVHVIKSGFDFRRLRPEVRPNIYGQVVIFPDLATTLTAMPSVSIVSSSVLVQSSFVNYSAYIQDTWKASVHLSVTFGVRWDYNPAPIGRGRNELSPFPVQGINDLSALSLARPGRHLYEVRPNNVAPRFGLAYHLGRSSNAGSILRAGAGMFYDLGNGAAGNAFSGTFFPFSAVKVLSGVPFPLGPAAVPPAITTTAPFSPIAAFPAVLKTPYTYQWNLSLEQLLGENQKLTLAYVGAAAHSMLRTEQYVGGVAGVPLAFEQLFFTNNSGYSNYNAFQAQFLSRTGKGLDIIAAYTLSHSLDNVSTDAVFNGIPGRFLDPRIDYGRSDFDIRHTSTIGLDYDLPTPSNPHVIKMLFSNWAIDSILVFRTSPPVNVVVSRDIGFGRYDFRPDLIPGVPMYIRDPVAPGRRRINTAALSVPNVGRQGDLGRNVFAGFALFQTDLAVRRQFRMSEKVSLQARIEAFNLFNHPNFAPEAAQLGTVDSVGRLSLQSGFGISQSMLSTGLQTGSFGSGFSPLYQVGGSRSLQAALKLEF